MKQYKAFTLIELLVVIVIIGILATISTATFGRARSKALISKYRAERIQASKERYEECIGINSESECFLNTMIYSNALDGGRLYKKDVNTSDAGVAITSAGGSGGTFSPDGKYIVYTNLSDGNRLYKKDINTSDDGVAITTVVGSSGAFSPDGMWILYTGHSNGLWLYKKDANTNDDGVAIVDLGPGLGMPRYSPEGDFILYSGGYRIHKKNADDTSIGELLVPGEAVSFGVYTPDGNSILYLSYNSSQNRRELYKKNANNSEHGKLVSLVGMNRFSIFPW